MVGFARALSDGVALAYLADVYVLEGHRGRGLGRALLRAMKPGPQSPDRGPRAGEPRIGRPRDREGPDRLG